MTPLISVIIPTHNYGRYIRDAINSVQSQTVSDLEIIVVDDGSTDNTPAVLQAIRDRRLRVVRIPNAGVSAARNAGIALAAGHYIAFLDADDIWLPDKLALQLALMTNEPSLGLVFSDFTRFDDSGVLPGTQFSYVPEIKEFETRPAHGGIGYVMLGDVFAQIASTRELVAGPQTLMLRRHAVRHIQFPEGVHLCEDYEYLLHASRCVAVGFIAQPLVNVRRHGSNSFAEPAETMLPKVDVLRRFLLQDKLSYRERRTIKRRLAHAWASIGYHHFHGGRLREAARAYAYALVHPGRRLNAAIHIAALPFVALFGRLLPSGFRRRSG